MTLPDKQNDALCKLVGWRKFTPADFSGASPDADSRGLCALFTNMACGLWRPPKGGPGQKDCPNMATPEGMVDLMEFCRERRFPLRVSNDGVAEIAKKACEGEWVTPDRLRIVAKTPAEAVCQAVLGLLEGGYLTEKENE